MYLTKTYMFIYWINFKRYVNRISLQFLYFILASGQTVVLLTFLNTTVLDISFEQQNIATTVYSGKRNLTS